MFILHINLRDKMNYWQARLFVRVLQLGVSSAALSEASFLDVIRSSWFSHNGSILLVIFRKGLHPQPRCQPSSTEVVISGCP